MITNANDIFTVHREHDFSKMLFLTIDSIQRKQKIICSTYH